jgi:hypothetical protein
MTQAIVVISLLAALMITIRLVTKSLYKDRKPTSAVHPREHVRAKAASHVARTTTS